MRLALENFSEIKGLAQRATTQYLNCKNILEIAQLLIKRTKSEVDLG